MVLLAQLAAAAVLYLGGSAQLAEQAVRSHHADVGTTMVQLTRRWLGAPYRAFSLDQSPQEHLQVDLQGFDCFLLVEQALALARSHTKQHFERELQQLRYGGRATNYCHRQHYFSRWAQTAMARGAITDLNPELPGVTQRLRRLNFMSRHPGSYQPMQQQHNRDCIDALERDLQVQQRYIPLQALPQVLPKLRNGDISNKQQLSVGQIPVERHILAFTFCADQNTALVLAPVLFSVAFLAFPLAFLLVVFFSIHHWSQYDDNTNHFLTTIIIHYHITFPLCLPMCVCQR